MGFAVEIDPTVGQSSPGSEMTAEYMVFVRRQVIETAEMSPERKGFVVSNLHAADHSLQIAEEMSEFEFEK